MTLARLPTTGPHSMADFVENYLQPELDLLAAAGGLDPTAIANIQQSVADEVQARIAAVSGLATQTALAAAVSHQVDVEHRLDGRIDGKQDAFDLTGLLSTVASLGKASSAADFSFSDRIVIDDLNTYGGGAKAIYVPQQVFLSRNGGDYFSATLTPASGEMPGYVKLLPTSVGGSTTVYLDLTKLRVGNLAALGIISSPDGFPAGTQADIVEILTLSFGAGVVRSAFANVRTSDLPGHRLTFDGPLVVQPRPDLGKTYLLVPKFWAVREGLGAATQDRIAPSDGSAFFEIEIDAGVAIAPCAYVFDYPGFLAGGSPVVADRTFAPYNPPKSIRSSRNRTVIAWSYGDRVVSEYTTLRAGDIAANTCPLSYDPFAATSELFSSTISAAIGFGGLVGPISIVHGITASDQALAYAEIVGPNGVGYFFVREYVLTATVGVYGTPRIYLYDAAGNNKAIDLTLERAIGGSGPYAAIYSASGRIDLPAPLARYAIGGIKPTGTDIRYCAMQFAASDRPIAWIDRYDFPPSPTTASMVDGVLRRAVAPRADLLIPPELWVTAGHNLPVFPRNATGVVSDGEGAVATIEVVPDNGGLPWGDTGDLVLTLRPASGSSGSGGITVRDRVSAVRRAVAVTVKVAPASGLTGSPTILCIGDSICDQQQAGRLKANLTARGLTPNMIGTILEATPDGGTPSLCEGRGGMRASELVYIKTSGGFDTWEPLAPEDVTAYRTTYNKGQKQSVNPFLRVAAAGDPPSFVQYDLIWDLRFYLNRMGLPDPTHVTFNLGTNDYILGGTTYVADFAAAIRILVAQARTALPSANIAFIAHRPGFFGAPAGRDYWQFARTVLAEFVKFALENTDPKVTVIPAYLHESIDSYFAWDWSRVPIDGLTGLYKLLLDGSSQADGLLADDVHPGRSNRLRSAEVIGSWVAATL